MARYKIDRIMKKIINKLFKWLGYVPKEEVAKLEYSISKYPEQALPQQP